MTVNKTLKTLAATLLIALSAEPVFAQDLLARQAPVDRRAKRLDSVEVRTFTERENTHTPAAQIYGDDWNNRYAHRATELPDSFVINLRHFSMPTPSRVITSTPSVRPFRAKFALYATKPEAMETISLSGIPTGWKPFTVTFQSNWLPKIRWYEQANPSVWEEIQDVVRVRICTLNHAFVV